MSLLHEIGKKWRKNELQISEDIIYRWSPRLMNGQALTKDELMPLLDAARWAPSSRNSQEWRFFYALRGEKQFQTLFDFLSENNQKWCKDAGALLILVSKRTTVDGHSLRSHSLDTGMAYQNFHIEGTRRNLVIHPLGAFNRQAAGEFLNLGEDYHLEIMISVGKPGNPDAVEKDRKPTERHPLGYFVTHLTD